MNGNISKPNHIKFNDNKQSLSLYNNKQSQGKSAGRGAHQCLAGLFWEHTIFLVKQELNTRRSTRLL